MASVALPHVPKKSAAHVWHTWPLLRVGFYGRIRKGETDGGSVLFQADFVTRHVTRGGIEEKRKDTAECCGREYTPFTEEIGS